MEKIIIENLVNKKLSTRKIAKELNCSQSTVKYWLKKYGLKTYVKPRLTEEDKKKLNVKRVTNRRKQLKKLAVEYKGGKCVKCNYDKCIDALEFHHLNPDEKDFSISHKGYTMSLEKVQKELDKCILVCANCHREIHSGEA